MPAIISTTVMPPIALLVSDSLVLLWIGDCDGGKVGLKFLVVAACVDFALANPVALFLSALDTKAFVNSPSAIAVFKLLLIPKIAASTLE